MSTLYVVHQNTKIRIRNRRLQVERDPESAAGAGADGGAEVLLSLPAGQVSQLVLFGNIGLTTPAIDLLLAQNAEVVFLTQNGEYRGELVSSLTPHVPMRRAQYRCLEDSARSLSLAKGFAAAKLQHQRALLLRHSREARGEELGSCVERLAAALASLPNKTSLDSLRGLEGAATAAYFSAFRSFFSPEWKFHDRNRRPPADPVNVLLSFGYTLLAQAASAAVQTVGLDPFVGFLHEYVYNRPALALDLMEEFRPVVDGLVLWCCRSGQLTPGGDFRPGPPERPVILDEDGKRRFLAAYQQRLDQTYTHPLRGLKFPLRQCMIEQARQASECILGKREEYQPMGFR